MADKASGQGFCDYESDSEHHRKKAAFANPCALNMIKSFIAFKVPNLIESSHSLDSLRLEFNWFQKKKKT